MNSKNILDALAKATVSYVKKPWGEEIIIYPDGVSDLQIKFITVNDGKKTSLQHHPEGREVAFILSGEGCIIDEWQDPFGDMSWANNGQSPPSNPIEIQPGDVHRSVGPVTLLEFTTAGPHDIVRHQDDYMREGTTGE